MIRRYTHNKLTWLDVISPSTEEIREVITEANIPLEFTGDLTTMTPRSEVIAKKGIIKITLDFPIVKRTDINHPHEVKFIATKNHLVTIRFEDIEAVHRYSKEFEVSSMITNAGKKATGAHICFSLLEHMYRTMTTKLDYLESKMTDIQEEIYLGKEKEMVFEISHVSRRLITFRQTIRSHELPLAELPEKVTLAFGKSYVGFVETLKDEFDHQQSRLQSVIKMLEDLRATNDSLLSTKQNEIMKIFTILAFVTFPLTLFTSMFGMNTATTPIIGQEGDFWIILGAMAVISISFFAYFWYKRWL